MIAVILVVALALIGAWFTAHCHDRMNVLEQTLRKTRREQHEWTQLINERFTMAYEAMDEIERLAVAKPVAPAPEAKRRPSKKGAKP